MQHDCTPRRSPYSYTEDRNSQKEMALSARNIDGANSFVMRSNNYDEAVMAAMIRPGPPYILSGPSPVTRFQELRAVTASRQLLFAVDGTDEHEDAADDHIYHHVKKKRRLTTEQVKSLEKSFEMECKLEPLRKNQLAQELGLQPRQVAIWFQNRRARYKTKLLEQDYSVLKKQYDDVCLEKEKLQAEVTKLSALLEAKKKQPGSSRPCCCELVTSAVKQEEEEEEEKGEDPAAARSEGQGPDDHETRRQAEMEAMSGTDQSEVEDAGSPGGEDEEEEEELEGGGPIAMAMVGAMTMEKRQVCGSQVVQQMAVNMEDGYYPSITEEELYYNNYYYTLLGGNAHTQEDEEEDDDEVAAIQPHPPPLLCFDWPPSYYPC